MQGIGINDKRYYSFKKFGDGVKGDDGEEGEYKTFEHDGSVYTIFDSASDNIYISALWYDRLM